MAVVFLIARPDAAAIQILGKRAASHLQELFCETKAREVRAGRLASFQSAGPKGCRM